MIPHTTSRLEPSANAPDPPPAPDLTRILEQHIAIGFPPDLALDLVLNELVVRAADATHASAAALALTHGDEIVYRAATGVPTRDLGVPLDTRSGLSAACVRTRTPQLSTDTNSDPRVDSSIFHNLGIRSILVVPLFDEAPATVGAEPPLAGVLEILSPLPNAFNQSTQTSLEEFARECVRIRQAAANLPDPQRTAEPLPPATELPAPHAELPVPQADLVAPAADLASPRTSPDDSPAIPQAQQGVRENYVMLHLVDHGLPQSRPEEASQPSPPLQRVIEWPKRIEPRSDGSFLTHTSQPYERWTLVLAVLVMLAAVAISFMIGARIGWLRGPERASSMQPAPPTPASSAAPAATPSSPVTSISTTPPETKATTSPALKSAANEPAKKPATTKPPSSADELVVYENGKIVFRLKPVPPSSAVSGEGTGSIPAAASAQSAAPNPSSAKSQNASPVPPAAETHIPSPRAVWLAPSQAESRLLTRVEPQYPADALAAHRSGDVVLEVHVAEDGTVSAVRTLSGDPILATAAAEAVRHWRYQPYSVQGHPAEFQTDVTLKFSLPD